MLKEVKLQNLVFPNTVDANIRMYPELMSRSATGKDNPFCYDPLNSCHILEKLKTADMVSYFNCLQIGRWKRYTYARNFKLHLIVSGKFSVELLSVFTSSANANFEVLKNESYNSGEKAEFVIDIPETDKALIGIVVTALSELHFYEGWYSAEVEEESIRDVKISLVTTTFRKQSYIKSNMRMLKNKVLDEKSELKGHLFVHVIDNERALNPQEFDCEDLKIYPNPNVGGAGGFTRGMIEAMKLEQKPSHVLLMDDDVLIMDESLYRTYFLLRIVKEEYAGRFVSGAMFDYDLRERQYEDVGCVNRVTGAYGPVKPPMDMRWISSLIKNEQMSDSEAPDSYAGWWFCCIPVTHIEERGLPVPVFVRGDDVEFSLRNKPGFLTLNGINIWHVGFAGKFNAAMELYQVHRNSLVIQAASGVCGEVNFIERIKPLFWKEITRFAYGNAELLLDSIEDFLKGPEYITTLNGEESLKEHAAKNEKLVAASSLEYPNADKDDPYDYVKMSLFAKGIYVLTINGHLLPNFLLKNYPAVISFDWFFCPGKNFLRKKLIAVNPHDSTACLRNISRKQCFPLIRRYLKVMGSYKKNHEAVEAAYSTQFQKMTSDAFWKEYLGL